jgi:hypothetical protein
MSVGGMASPSTLAGSRVDNELDLGGLCHRQVARRIALENARRAQSHATIGIAEIGSIAHQPAGARGIAIGAHRRALHAGQPRGRAPIRCSSSIPDRQATSQGLAAVRDFGPANVSSGSKARITAVQQQRLVHLN